MNDEECQPEYCDCEGFHTGACRQREAERQLFASPQWRAALEDVFGCPPYELPHSDARFPIDSTRWPDQLGPTITHLQFDNEHRNS